MAKKRFTAGMESLFGDTQDQSSFDQGPLLSEKKGTKRSASNQEKSSGKGFRENLKAFLQDAFEESLETQLEERRTNKTKAARDIKPRGGLDALLRSTIEPTKIKLQNKPIRRLTISFYEEKLDKLKSIARSEKIYLKDIIDEIVGEYIEGYESEKGPIDAD